MRSFIIIAELVVLLSISIWLATQPGSVVLEWGDYHLETTLSVGFLVVAGSFILLAFILKIWHFIIMLPARMYAYTQKLRPEKGMQALTQSVISTALEEYEQARTEAYRFERYLGDNAIYKGLLALNDLQAGKFDQALKICETMKTDGDSKTLSWILEARIAMEEGKDIVAHGALQNLYQLHEKSPWVMRELLKYSLKLKMYEASLEVLKKAERLNVISMQVIKDSRAKIFYHQAEKVSTGLEQKEELLAQAHRLAPESVKIVVHYSKVLRLSDKSKRAKKALEQSWTVHPHIELLEEYVAIDHETDPKILMKTAAKLMSYNEHHPESYLAIARFALKMQEWGRARAALHDYQEKSQMTREACYLMARLELSQHGDQARYREWMERALHEGKISDVGEEGFISISD
jgi:HemY protein